MIHVVFSKADEKILQEVLALDETLAGEIVVIQDEYEIGPLENIYIGEGKETRKQWWSESLGKNFSDDEDDYKAIAALVGEMRRNEDATIYIWAAQNAHDVCGYYWILHFMKEFQGRVEILYLNNLPFINEKGNIFYPQFLHQIAATEFLKAKKLARVITPSEFEVDPDEWIKIMGENKGIRILEGGKKIVQFDYDYFDAALKKFVTPSFQKVNKILQQVGAKNKIEVSDEYLIWRLKTLLSMQLLESQGEVMKDLEFKTF